MTDIDDEGRKAELDAKQQLLAQRDIDDIQFVMGSEQGRRVIWSLLEKRSGVWSLLQRRSANHSIQRRAAQPGSGSVSARHGALPRSVSEDGRRGQ